MVSADDNDAIERFVQCAIEAGVQGFTPVTEQQEEIQAALRVYMEDEKWHMLVNDIPNVDGYKLIFVYHEDIPQHGFGSTVTGAFYPERLIGNIVIHFKQVLMEIRQAEMTTIMSAAMMPQMEEEQENNNDDKAAEYYTH